MQFLVISQRAIPNPNYSLKDLTGHGRIDVIMRCILASCRLISKVENERNKIYCYLKGSVSKKTRGWITWDQEIFNEDEISIAAIIKNKWFEIFTPGPLEALLRGIAISNIIYLHEDGEPFYNITNHISKDSLVVLGAQSDLNDEDHTRIPIDLKVKISDESMLASQAITFFRQRLLVSKY